MPERRTPLWLWPNLLSLDAPVVAVAWLYMFQKIWLMVLPWGYYAALGLVVWGIYLTDRIADLKMLPPGDPRLGSRHRFIQRCGRWPGIVAAMALLGALLVAGGHIPQGPLVDYGRVVLPMVGIFFCLTVFSMQDREIPHLRNLVAGLAFSYGTAMGAHMWVVKPGIIDLVYPHFNLLVAPEMLVFALLCSINITAIHFWEQAAAGGESEDGWNDLAIVLPLAVLGAACIGFAAKSEEVISRPFYYAVLISAALLYAINRIRTRCSIDALRVLADAAMLAPLPIFWALSGS